MPEVKDKLLIVGYESVHWENESDTRTLCPDCYVIECPKLRASFHTLPLFRNEALPQDKCDKCKKRLS